MNDENYVEIVKSSGVSHLWRNYVQLYATVVLLYNLTALTWSTEAVLARQYRELNNEIWTIKRTKNRSLTMLYIYVCTLTMAELVGVVASGISIAGLVVQIAHIMAKLK